MLGSEKGIGCMERADFASDDVPEVNMEPFIAVSPSPAEAAPMGPGVIEIRDATRCRDLDPEP